MTRASPRGTIYRCPVCGAEVAVLAGAHGKFTPRCCNTRMVPLPRRMTFFRCPVCGAEVGVLSDLCPMFSPRCCNTAMQREAA